MSEGHLSRRELAKIAYRRFLMGIPVLMLIFFLPAGTLAYWQGWVYIAILYIPMIFMVRYLLKNSPDLLERRLRLREREPQQQWIIILSSVVYILAFLLPGFDHRWGWSHVPLWLAILGQALVLAGYGVIVLVFRENRYAARVVDVEEEQQVISSGPYAMVRHPMYTGTMLMVLATPLALGSWWALIPAAAVIPALVARIHNEEAMLSRELKGYEEYRQRVKYRLVPGVW